MLAAEGLLGHQHANSGWGTFDDDNMVGATAFMETLELAVELRRARLRRARRAARLRPLPVHRGRGRRRRPQRAAVELHREVSGRIDDAALREAQSRKDAIRAYELVYAASARRAGHGADRARRARRRHDRGQGARALRRTARCSRARERGYPLSTPQPGWAEQDPEDWWRAAEAALAEVAGRPRRRRHRPLGPDARPRRARRRRAGDPAGDPLERPAHGGGVRRDRGAGRARAADRADGQPRADRLHRAEAPLAAPARAGRLRADRAACCCRRTTSGCGSRASRRSTPPTRPGRCSSTSQRRAGATRSSTRSRSRARGSRPSSSRPTCRGGAGRRARSPRGAGDQPAAALGVGIDRPGTLSVVLGTSGVVLARSPRTRHDAEARVHAFCHAVPGTWQAMGVMLSAAGSLHWLRDAVAPGRAFDELVAEAEAWAPGAEGLVFLPVPRRRADAARRSRRARRVRRPRARHDRGRARPRGARGRRLRAARLARAPPRARRRGRRRRASRAAARAAGCGSRSSRPCSASRSSSPRSRRGRPSVRRSSAASPAASSPTSHEAVAACVRVTRDASSPIPPGTTRTTSSTRATARCIRRSEPLEGMTTNREARAPLHRQHQPARSCRRRGNATVEVVAVASRDAARAEAYAASTASRRAHGSYEALLADPERRRRLHLASERHAPRVVDARARGRQARALREAVHRGTRPRPRRRSTPPTRPASC